MRLLLIILLLFPLYSYSQKTTIDSTLNAIEKMVSMKHELLAGKLTIKEKKCNKKRFIICGYSNNRESIVVKTKISKTGLRTDKIHYDYAANKIRLVKNNGTIYKFSWKKYSSEAGESSSKELYFSQKIIFLKDYLMQVQKYDSKKRIIATERYFY